MMLLVGMLAMSAMAQTGDPTQTQAKPEDPLKTQTIDRTFDGADSDGTGTATHTQQFSGPESMGEASGKGDGTADDGLKSIDGETDGVKERTLNYVDAPGIDANGGIVRNGGDFVEEGGPHGPIGPGPDESNLFIDENSDGFNDYVKTLGEDGTGTMTLDGKLENERQIHGPGVAGPYDVEDGFGEASLQDVGTGTVVRDRGTRRK